MRHRAITLLLSLVVLALAATATQAAPQSQDGAVRAIQNIWMSDKANGTPLEVFPTGAKSVFVVFDYKDAADTEIQVKVYDPKGKIIYVTSKKYSGAGRENIEIKPSDPLPDGAYVTNGSIGVNGQFFLSETSEWYVGEPPAKPTDAPISAAQAKVANPANPANAASQTNAAQPVAPAGASAATTAVNADAGMSMPLLIGAGILALGLLALVVWAVRGFMTAPRPGK